MVQYRVVAISTKGRYREQNEDCLFCVDKGLDGEVSVQYLLEDSLLEDGLLKDRGDMYFAVFDGMGGMDAGKHASKFCCGRLQQMTGSGAVEKDMGKMIEELNQSLCCENKQTGKNMGSTVVLLKLNGSAFRAANLGDSRCYYFDRKKIRQISVDHTEAEEYRRLMSGSPVDGRLLKQMESVLTQYLGVSGDEFVIEPFVSEEIMIQSGEVLMLCSDGVREQDMSSVVSILSSERDLGEKGEMIVKTVIEHGGKDNITVILIEKE